MATVDVRLELDDTIVLLDDDHTKPSLLGRVTRTYHTLDSHEALEDCLIIAHVPVETQIIQQFIDSGRPPKGYVFVEFAHEESGYALLPEDAVHLISRAVVIGDAVKQDANGAMFGTVIDIQSSYVLCPIFEQTPDQTSPIFPDWLSSCPSNVDTRLPAHVFYATPAHLLYEIPGDDLKRAEDFAPGDHVLSSGWFGLVEATDVDIALLLEDESIVWVERPWELEIIVRNLTNKPLVALPEFDLIRRPDILNAHRDGVTSMNPKRLGLGATVITNKRNLQEGRWLRGSYNVSCPPRGVVVDIRTRRLDMNWLVPSAFAESVHANMPSSRLRPYDNLTSFRNPRDLRPAKDLTRYDHDKAPRREYPVPKSPWAGDLLHPGDRVRFRGSSRNEPNRVSRDASFGFDINEYSVVLGQHQATVLWQDGTTSSLDTTKITLYSLPESDLSPGDLVLGKDGLKMVDRDNYRSGTISDFNEMSFFEKNHVLVPAKVGVVQSVDAQERLARVRWYADPKIQLNAFGQVLLEPLFGKIGDKIEDVSLYEIMTQPVLVRKRGDMVVIPPQGLTTSSRSPQTISAYPDLGPGPTTLSHLRQVTSDVSSALSDIARPFSEAPGPGGSISVNRYPIYDWIGEIVNLGLDGSLTVRLGGLKDCKDIEISHDEVLLTIEEMAEYADVPDSMDLDGDSRMHDIEHSDSDVSDIEDDTASAIDEEVEYEGGERLDDESGEDDWSTDEEASDPLKKLVQTDEKSQQNALFTHHAEETMRDTVPMVDHNIFEDGGTSTDAAPNVYSNRRPISSAQEVSPSLARFLHQKDPPASFEVLEQSPPANQYCANEEPLKLSHLLKRIAREHAILSSALPAGEIYVRTYESRLDLLRCLIVGPADTPYEYCPFVVDLYLGLDFPQKPPKAHFHSWTSGLGRVNPNLYEDGKICLSLLGTWEGQNDEEKWSEKATILQLLVSLQGLVLVSKPFYNEAGFELHNDDKAYRLESLQYSEKAYVISRGFVKYALANAPDGLEDVITWLYLSTGQDQLEIKSTPRLLSKVIRSAKLLMERSVGLKALTQDSSLLVDGSGDSSDPTKTFVRPLSRGAQVMLEKIVIVLEQFQFQYDQTAAE